MDKTYLSLEEAVPSRLPDGSQGRQEKQGGISVQLKDKSTKTPKGTKQSTWYYMGVAGEIGFSVALPIAGGGILGSFLDSRWGTYPKMTLSLLFGGIILSVINFVFVVKTILDREK